MRYRVVRRLGRGGMGVVDLAVDTDGTEVALKRLSLHGSPDEVARARARIRREAEVLRSVDHPAIVRLLDLTDDGDDVVLVMPYLAGGSLHDRIRADGPLSAASVATLADRLLDALAAAHRQGIVHRDITPANILFTAEGEATLADFGVAWARDHTPGLTATAMVVGTPAFMAPEQARGEPASSAADVFSLGATLLYALIGVGPYGSPSTDPRVLMHRAARGRVERPPRDVPPELRALLTDALERTPAKRPSAAGLRGGAAGTDPVSRLASAVGRRRLIAAGAGVVLVLLLLGAAAVIRDDDSRQGTASRDPASPSTTVAATSSPCVPRRYQPCGPDGLEDPAAHTDGIVCDRGYAEYDLDLTNGCETAADDLEGEEQTVLSEDRPARRANIVPRSDVDEWRLPVDDDLDITCAGRLTITLTAPAGEMVLEMRVTRDGEVIGTELSTAGRPATMSVGERCLGNDSGTIVLRVALVAGSPVVGDSYTVRREGSF